MPAYTADTVALLAYLADALPERADRVFAEAEAGETVVQTPATAVAETLYSVSRDKDVRGITLQRTPERARQALLDTGPVTVSAGDDELVEFAAVVDEFSIRDAMVVASHRAAGTDGIVTSDGVIGDAGYETVWD